MRFSAVNPVKSPLGAVNVRAAAPLFIKQLPDFSLNDIMTALCLAAAHIYSRYRISLLQFPLKIL